MERSHIDGQYFEVVRGAAPDPSLKQLTQAGVAALHRRPALSAPPFHRHYAGKLFPAPAVRRAAFREDVLLGQPAIPSTCTSSAWNPRRNGRCFARPAKPPS